MYDPPIVRCSVHGYHIHIPRLHHTLTWLGHTLVIAEERDGLGTYTLYTVVFVYLYYVVIITCFASMCDSDQAENRNANRR